MPTDDKGATWDDCRMDVRRATQLREGEYKTWHLSLATSFLPRYLERNAGYMLPRTAYLDTISPLLSPDCQ
jgi:hypothetical protein